VARSSSTVLSPVPDRADNQQDDRGTHNYGCWIFEIGEKVGGWHRALLPSEGQLSERAEENVFDLTPCSFRLAGIGREVPFDDFR
jgi:hypothetical protein